RGRMAAVGLAGAEARKLVAPFRRRLWVAGENSPGSVTLSGDAEALERLKRELSPRKVFWKDLRLNYAFHSHHMDPIRQHLLSSLSGLRPSRRGIGFISTVTGGPLGAKDLDAAYWWDNIRRPVLFSAAISRLAAEGHSLFLEIGPHPVLSGYLAECLSAAG